MNSCFKRRFRHRCRCLSPLSLRTADAFPVVAGEKRRPEMRLLFAG